MDAKARAYRLSSKLRVIGRGSSREIVVPERVRTSKGWQVRYRIVGRLWGNA